MTNVVLKYSPLVIISVGNTHTQASTRVNYQGYVFRAPNIYHGRFLTKVKEKPSAMPRMTRAGMTRALQLLCYLLHLSAVSTTDARKVSIPQPRIIGGTNADKGRYPYMVSLVNSFTRAHKCGGVLVAKDMVLTAAHCVGKMDLAQVGRYNRLDVNETYDELSILKEYPHPLYLDAFSNYDFMLLKLDGSSNNNLVRLNKDKLDSDNSPILTAIGFGVTDPDNYDAADILQEAKLNYMSNEICELSSDGENSYDGYLNNNMMCASAEERDTCYGDSGGPLLIRHEENPEESEIDFVVGITSWGFDCADPNFPGVYARISQQYHHIIDTICELSDYPPTEYYDCPSFGTDGTIELVVKIQLDQYPKETSWKLTCTDDNLVYGHVGIGDYELKHMEEVQETIMVPDGVTCTFSIRDEYGDGLGLTGNFQILIDDKLVTNGGYNFGYEQSRSFTIPAIPSSGPSESPTVVPSTVPTEAPSSGPSESPTVVPSTIPTEAPSSGPSESPTVVSSTVPTQAPSQIPTDLPSQIAVAKSIYIRKTKSPSHFSKDVFKMGKMSYYRNRLRGNERNLDEPDSQE